MIHFYSVKVYLILLFVFVVVILRKVSILTIFFCLFNEYLVEKKDPNNDFISLTTYIAEQRPSGHSLCL